MSIFTDRELQSGKYRWRKDNGKILVTTVSQPFRLVHTEEEKIIRQDDRDDSNVDTDALYLEKFFKEASKFPLKVEWKFRQNINFDDYINDYIDVMDKKFDEYEKYDCFVFVFLTYIGEQSPGDQKLHFFDRGIPLEDILDKVKAQEVTRGKPKIFLIQSDDNSLLDETFFKGPVAVTERKIPQDADRLIIQSTIPQVIGNSRLNPDPEKPSFLVQAFTEALTENWKLEDRKRDDFLSLTTVINGKVANMIIESRDKTAKHMQVPLVTSTLTKQLMF